MTYRIIKFYKDIQNDRVYSYTGYDITSYFRSAVIAKITNPPIGWARHKRLATKIRGKAVGGGTFGRFFFFEFQ